MRMYTDSAENTVSVTGHMDAGVRSDEVEPAVELQK